MLAASLACLLIANATQGQSPRIQEISQFHHTHKEGDLLARTFYIANFDQLHQPWPKLESWLKNHKQEVDGLGLMLLYRDRMAAPDLQFLLADLPSSGTIGKQALRKIADQLTEECVLLYWHAGSRGAMLQYPKQHRQQFLQMIEQL